MAEQSKKSPVTRKPVTKKRPVTRKIPARKKIALPPMRKNLKEWDKQAVMNYVCETMASSSDGLGNILKSTGYKMPDRTTVITWIGLDKTFQNMYARAREAQADYMLEDINEIANNVGQVLMIEGEPLIVDGKPVMIVDAASVNHARLIIDTRKWTMAKVSPKKYGEKLTLDGDIDMHMTFEQAIQKAREERLVN
tara:strand:+ start:2961 stop:3545 length:585 start_codon:yes stop_codon:yes gene_type:complete